MKDELFSELAASVREGGAILNGKTPPARTFKAEELCRHEHQSNLC